MLKQSFINLTNGILALISLILAFYIFNSIINLHLAYHLQQPLALLDFEYFKHDIKDPAGLANYAGSVLSDLWGFPYLGIIATLFLFTIIPVVEYVRLYRKVKSSFATTLSLSLFALLIIVFTDYSVNAGLFFAVLFAYLFVLLFRFLSNNIKSLLFQILLLPPLLFLVYLTAGVVGLTIFVLFSVFSIMKNRTFKFSKTTHIGFIIVCSLVIPFILSVCCYSLITIPVAYIGNFVLLKPSLIFYIGIAVVLVLNTYIVDNPKKETTKISKWMPISLSLIIVLFLWLGPTLRIDKERKLRIEIDYFAYTGNWGSLLKKANPQLMHEKVMAFQINRALYNTGGLLQNLFNFPQYLGNSSLLLENEPEDVILIPTSDIYYEMGYLNESRHWANEALTRYGKQPRILKRLAQINIVYGNYNGARKYIELLKKTCSHKKWALEQEKYLFNDAKVQQSTEYSGLLKLMPKDDFFATKSSPQINLVNLNKYQNNRMVFEYLMAYALLEKNVAKLIKNIDEFSTLKYRKLPGNVEQAVGIYMNMTHSKNFPLAGYQFSPTYYKQFQDYSIAYNDFTKGVAGAKNKLDQKFQSTYWYYIHFIGPNAKHKS